MPFKEYQTISIYCFKGNLTFFITSTPVRGKLFGGTVLPNNTLFGRTVPPNNTLFGGTVPPNSTLFGRTPNSDQERNQQFYFFLKKTFWLSDDGLLLEPSKNYVTKMEFVQKGRGGRRWEKHQKSESPQLKMRTIFRIFNFFPNLNDWNMLILIIFVWNSSDIKATFGVYICMVD